MSNLATPAAHAAALRKTYDGIAIGEAGPALGTAVGGLHLGLDLDTSTNLDAAVRATDRELARRAGVRAGCRVLDAGCGVGGSAVWLAAELGAVVTGVTLLEAQVALAQARARAAGVDVAFLAADYLGTGLPPASFDLIWQLESLCHCTQPAVWLRHAHGLLAPGGRYAAIDVFVGEGGAEVWARLAQTAAFGAPNTLEGYSSLLRTCGYVEVEVEDLTPRAIASARLWRDFALLSEALYATPTAARSPLMTAAIDFADGLATGALRYGLVLATRGDS